MLKAIFFVAGWQPFDNAETSGLEPTSIKLPDKWVSSAGLVSLPEPSSKKRSHDRFTNGH